MQPTIEEVKRATARHFGVSVNEIDSHRRQKSIVRIRQISMTAAKRLTSHSLPKIAGKFGGRDHTTLLHAIRKIEGLLDSDASIASDLAAIVNQFQLDPDLEVDSEDIDGRVYETAANIVRIITDNVGEYVNEIKASPDIIYKTPPAVLDELIVAISTLDEVRYSASEKRAIERVIALGKKLREANKDAA